jgi:hypothetical protein
MLTTSLLLLIAAFVCCLASSVGRLPLWIAVMLLVLSALAHWYGPAIR